MPDKRPRRGVIAAAGAVVLAGVLALVLVLASGGGPRHPTRSAPTPGPSVGPLRAGPPARPPPATEQLGVNAGLLFNLGIYNPTQINAQLSALARTGATLVRTDAPWEATEPRPPVGGVPQYNWRFDDGIAGALAEHRLQWLPIIDYSPPWVRSVPGVDHSAPSSPAAYAAYAGALAARYGPGGSFWRLHPQLHPEPVQTYEIWNEPDNPYFWRPRPDPAAYAQLYLRARVAITSTQPRARVIIGGLTRPTRFLPALLAAQPLLRGHIDGVGIHPYGRDPQRVLARVRAARLALRSLGLPDVPLYVTEFGWKMHPADHGSLGTSARARFIFQTLGALRHTDCGLATALLYAWFTPERDPVRGWYGIDPLRPARTPAVAAFTDALSAAGARASEPRLCSGRPGHS